jgi:hypothetical protein
MPRNPVLEDLRKFRRARPNIPWKEVYRQFQFAVGYGWYVDNNWQRYERDNEFVIEAGKVLARLARLG